jgi:hypothetical protein
VPGPILENSLHQSHGPACPPPGGPLRLAAEVCFTPFDKQALTLAHPPSEDEIGCSAEVVGRDGPAGAPSRSRHGVEAEMTAWHTSCAVQA